MVCGSCGPLVVPVSPTRLLLVIAVAARQAGVVVLSERDCGSTATARLLAGELSSCRPITSWRRSVFDQVADEPGRRSSGSVLAYGVARVEQGADGRVSNLRYISWVRLRHRDTGDVFVVINTHLIPTIDRAGHPDTSKPARLRVHDQEVSRLLEVVARMKPGGPVIATMDANIDARAGAPFTDPRWPAVRMGRHGLSSNWRVLGYPTGGTHQRRLIDYVWATTSSLRPTGQQILGRYGFDHNTVASR